MDSLSRAVQQALQNVWFISIRSLAKRASLTHVALVHINTGERSATVRVAEALATALREFSVLCADAAERLEREVRKAERS